MTPDERARIEAVAKELGTFIPATRSIYAWPIDIIEVLAMRVLELERREANRATEGIGHNTRSA